MIFSNSLATKESLDRALASVNMASAPETTPFPANKSKKSKRNREASVDNTIPASNNACAAPVTRHLEFHQAMRDFKVMFPKMEWATIETVLRANNGAVDATIDQLLTLTNELPESGPIQINSMQLGHTPSGLGHTPSGLSHASSGLGHTPSGLGHTPSGLSHTPSGLDHTSSGLGHTPSGNSPPPMYRGPVGEEQPPPYSPPSPTSPFSQMSRPAPKTLNTSTTNGDSMFEEFMSTLQSTPPHPPSRQGPIALNRSFSLNTSPSGTHRRWNPPLLGELPDNFLRIHSVTQTPSIVSSHLRQRLQQNVEQRSSVDKDDVEMQQMLNDERVALYMQNEEFMWELQHNPEFSAALESDVSEATREASRRNSRSHQSQTHSTQPAQMPNSTPHSNSIPPAHIPIHRNVLNDGMSTEGAAGGAAAGAGDDVVFRNKLKHMGKSTKVKFAQMARKFNSKKKKKSYRSGLEGAPAPSTANLLECEEDDDSLLSRHRPKVEENIYSDSRLI